MEEILKGFLWKIGAGEKKLKGFPFTSPLGQSCTCCILQGISFITPALILHVLHLKGISFITMGVGGRQRGRLRYSTPPPDHPGMVFWGWVGVPEPSPLSTSYPHGYQRNPYKNFSEQKNFQGNLLVSCATNPPTHPLLVDQNVQKFIEPLESGCTGGECWGWVGVPEPYPLSTSYPHGYQRNAFKNFSEQKNFQGNLL